MNGDSMIGRRFGEWMVNRYAETTRRGHWYWCWCSCGTKHKVLGVELRRGKTKSCGHDGSTYKHGYSRRGGKGAEYNIWTGLRDRCNNVHNSAYKNYGGRGIKVCRRWDDFEAFLADIGPRPGPQFSIDRINNDGDYSPSNCRWATVGQQRRNGRRIITVTHQGTTLCLKDWCRRLGVPYTTIFQRVRKGKAPAEALFGEGGQSKSCQES